MGIKVAKFGGTSLADAAQFKKVKSIIDLDQDRRFIVNSAPGKRFSDDIKVTDMLYQWKQNLNDKQLFEESMEKVSQRFQDIIDQLGVDLDLKPILKEIGDNILNGASDHYAASRGEYLNGRIMAAYLGYDFIDPADIIVFNADKKLNEEKTYQLATARLKKSEKAVVPGFYGADESGEIVTFSRGGSDITGAIVAKALQADIYENWTDVSGMLAADPRIVENPRPIEKISYKELKELASMGASVLHEDAVFPAKQAAIPINIRNTNRPEDAGTFVSKDVVTDGSAGLPTGIAGKDGFSFLHVFGTKAVSDASEMQKLLQILASHQLPLKLAVGGAESVSLLLQGSITDEMYGEIQTKLAEASAAEKVELDSNVALIAAVGEGLDKSAASAKAAMALSKDGIPMILSVVSSRQSLIVGVPAEDLKKAQKSLYQGLFA